VSVAAREKIENEIRRHGPIPFSRYMELCLYDPELGYYSHNASQFGKAGDYYTSSDVHAVFGRLLSRQFEEMWRALGSPQRIELLELGPGRGLLAQDVLDWSSKKFPNFFEALHYTLIEISPALRARIRQNLAKHFDGGKCSVLQDIPVGETKSSSTSSELSSDVRQIVLANEFFDALPVEVLSDKGELRIDTRDGRFVETWAPASAEELEYLDRFAVHPEPGERVEVPLRAQTYMVQAARLIQRGFFVAIDYGYTRPELLAGRHRGTVMAYRQHSASPNPYEAPGEQDITAHVNFTALASVAADNDFIPHKLLTQSQFLMGIGEVTQFADAFEDCRLPQECAKVALQLKHLVTPAGMGETFHVMAASKGIDLSVTSRLSGLSFGT
jgi:SAM-dependent MidA family methyltransferase